MTTFKDYGWFIGLISGFLLIWFNQYFWCELIMSIEITFGCLFLITVLISFFTRKFTKLGTSFKRAIFVIGMATLVYLIVFFNNWLLSFIFIAYLGFGLLDVIYEKKFIREINL